MLDYEITPQQEFIIQFIMISCADACLPSAHISKFNANCLSCKFLLIVGLIKNIIRGSEITQKLKGSR